MSLCVGLFVYVCVCCVCDKYEQTTMTNDDRPCFDEVPCCVSSRRISAPVLILNTSIIALVSQATNSVVPCMANMVPRISVDTMFCSASGGVELMSYTTGTPLGDKLTAKSSVNSLCAEETVTIENNVVTM